MKVKVSPDFLWAEIGITELNGLTETNEKRGVKNRAKE